jgi:hypothetical protein
MSEVFAKGVEKETGNDMVEKFRRTVEKSPLIKVTICYIDTECVLKSKGIKIQFQRSHNQTQAWLTSRLRFCVIAVR